MSCPCARPAQRLSPKRRRTTNARMRAVAALMLGLFWPAVGRAHHEALFGPQSSLAVESQGFVSLQTHVRAYGINGQQTTETITIVSGGFSPLADVPWGIALVQPFTYQTTRAPTPAGSTGPFSACDGCFRMENTLVSTQYRFDFKNLQRAWGKDGNFALLSAAIEPPTGNKDYRPLRGPINFIGAGMTGLERGPFSAVLLGYYRLNTPDAASSKKGDNFLASIGLGYTPLDEPDAMISFQLGLGKEHHFRDVANGASVDASGGSEYLITPAIVGSPLRHLRIFALVAFPVAQSYRDDGQVDRWRFGAGLIYSFDRSAHEPPSAVLPPRS
jgi:hypothetical protein